VAERNYQQYLCNMIIVCIVLVETSLPE